MHKVISYKDSVKGVGGVDDDSAPIEHSRSVGIVREPRQYSFINPVLKYSYNGTTIAACGV